MKKNKILGVSLFVLVAVVVLAVFFGSNVQGLIFLKKLQPVNTNFVMQKKDIVKKIIAPNLCNKEIKIDWDGVKNFDVDYCTHFINSNGLKYYFEYLSGDNPSLVVYTVRQFQGKDYVFYTFNKITSLPNVFALGSAYSQEQLAVNSFDSKHINLDIEDNCIDTHPFCNSFSFLSSNGAIVYYLDPSLFVSEQVKNNYVAKRKMFDTNSFNFLKDYLGFLPPVDNVYSFYFYAPDGGNNGSAYGYVTKHYYSKKVEQAFVDNLVYGNTHEFTHVFLTNFMQTVSDIHWFEEGFASYMADLNDYGSVSGVGLKCFDEGYRYGMGALVGYSDFYKEPDPGAGFDSPLNLSSYYTSGECFWVYISETYGEAMVKAILGKLNSLRFEIPPKYHLFIKDIVNPVVGTDLTNLVKTRYNYTDPI